jgi:hypothetical protein
MNETPQQYIQRMLGNLQGQNALKVQVATAKKLERLVKGVPLNHLQQIERILAPQTSSSGRSRTK